MSKPSSLLLPCTIVLVGLPGAGKSSIGRLLAERLAVPFTDLDREVEAYVGCSITDIFKYNPENYFRELEEKVVFDLLSRPPHILSTGGGAFINPNIRSLVKEKAISVWLNAPFDVLLQRITRRNTRPLFESTEDKASLLQQLIDERTPYYSEADCMIDSSNGKHEHVVQKIIKQLTQLVQQRM